ncbi:MAG: DUF2141 domain-containing protein [Chitinispirillaceae bacterium]
MKSLKLFPLLLLFVAAVPALAQDSVTLKIRMQGFRSTGNTALVGVYDEDKAAQFPKRDKAVTGDKTEVKDKTEVLTFGGLKPGTYAVAVLHDEDNNGKMSTNLLGMPKEGYGFSNDAEVKMRAPSFEEASFELEGDTTIVIDIKYF